MTFLSDRAHLSFVPVRSHPDWFSSGRSLRLMGSWVHRSTGGRSWNAWASTSGLRLPSAVRRVTTVVTRRSCLGLRLLQGWRAHGCASRRARPRHDHQPPEPHGPPFFVRPRSSNPLVGL